jgi:hypothetical protein
VKIIAATSRGQGDRPGDFNFALNGEIVVPATPCDSADCGCERSFAGTTTQKATTTAEIVDSALSRDDVITAIAKSRADGWHDHDIEAAVTLADSLLGVAAAQGVGTVLGILGGRIEPR